MHVFWGYCENANRNIMRTVIEWNLSTMAIAVALIVIGLLMLAYVVRGVPKSPTAGSLQGDVVLVATKSKKKAKGDS